MVKNYSDHIMVTCTTAQLRDVIELSHIFNNHNLPHEKFAIIMEEQQLQQLLEIILMKFYGVINDVTYDYQHFLRRLRDSDLISEERCQHIGSKTETFEKNRFG